MVIYVQERSPAGIMSRVAATTLFTYLQSQSTAIKSTFGTVLPVDNIFPKTGLNPEQLKHYLDNPPSGRQSGIALSGRHSGIALCQVGILGYLCNSEAFSLDYPGPRRWQHILPLTSTWGINAPPMLPPGRPYPRIG